MRCKRCGAPILGYPRDFPSCVICGWEDYSYTGDHVKGHPISGLADMKRSAGQGVQRGQQEAAGAPTARASVS